MAWAAVGAGGGGQQSVLLDEAGQKLIEKGFDHQLVSRLLPLPYLGETDEDLRGFRLAGMIRLKEPGKGGAALKERKDPGLLAVILMAE